MRKYTVIVIAILAAGAQAWADPTPPIMPQIQETPPPPPITLPAAPAPTAINEKPLSATEAVALALHRQPSLIAAQAGVTASEGRVQQARSGMLPTLGVSGGYAVESMKTAGATKTDGFTTAATLRQLIFDFNHTRELVRQSTVQVQSARANLTRAQSDLVFQVKQAFYTYAQNLRLVGVNEENLRNRQHHLAMSQARLQAGIGLPVDVVRAQTAVSEAVLSLNLAQNAASVSRVTLAQLLAVDPRTPIRTAEGNEPAPATDDYNALVTLAQRQRPEITQAQAAVQSAQLGTHIAGTTNAPALVGTVAWGSRGDDQPFTDHAITLGVAVQWNPFDAGLTQGRVQEAQANTLAAQAQLDSTRQSVTADVAQAYLNTKTAEQRVLTAQAEVANAEEGVRLAQGRYTAGLGVFLDVLDAQTALVTAQTNLVNTQSTINQARAALAHAVNGDPALAGGAKK